MTNRINFLEELATDVTHLQNKSMEIGEDINSMLRIVEE